MFLFTITVHSKAVQTVREMYLQRALTEEAVRDKGRLLIEKPKENGVSRREWPTDLSAAKRSLGRMEDFTEIKLLDTGSFYFFERDKIKKENVGK